MNATAIEAVIAELNDREQIAAAKSAAVALMLQRTEAPTAYSAYEALQAVSVIAEQTNFAEYYEATKVRRGVPFDSSYAGLAHEDQIAFQALAILELAEGQL